VRRRVLHIQPPCLPPLAPQSQALVTYTSAPPFPASIPFPTAASSLPRRVAVRVSLRFPAWLVRDVGRRRLDVGLHGRALQACRAGATGTGLLPTRTRRSGLRISSGEKTATNTLDNSVSLNTHTDYKISGGKRDVVIEQLLSR